MKDLLKEGAIVQAFAIISGDPAIYEYENGMVKDFEHNLAALRYTLIEGQAERLDRILAKGVVYDSVNYDKPIKGKEKVIDKLNYVHENTNIHYYALLATLTGQNEGERCIILSEGDMYNFCWIVRIKINSEKNISHIKLTNDKNLTFTIDKEPEYGGYGEDTDD